MRGHVAWALGRLSGPKAKKGLEYALQRESFPQVREEICLALAKEEPTVKSTAHWSPVAEVA